MSIAGLDEFGDNLFVSFDASARNYLNGEWVYLKLTYDANAPRDPGPSTASPSRRTRTPARA